jgi:hypothetical protein
MIVVCLLQTHHPHRVGLDSVGQTAMTPLTQWGAIGSPQKRQVGGPAGVLVEVDLWCPSWSSATR